MLSKFGSLALVATFMTNGPVLGALEAHAAISTTSTIQTVSKITDGDGRNIQDVESQDQDESDGDVTSPRATAPKVKIRQSDNKKISLVVTFPNPIVSITTAPDNETYTRVSISGVESQIGTPGEPAIPVWHTLIGIPHGATPVLAHSDLRAGQNMQVNLIPFQPEPVDVPTTQSNTSVITLNDFPPNQGDLGLPSPLVFADKPFAKNQQTYNTDAFLPPGPCKVVVIGQVRDLQIAQVSCATGAYNPVTRSLKLYKGVSLDIQYRGGAGTFISTQSLNPFEDNAAMDSVLNKDTLTRYVSRADISTLQCQGEELLILTHPLFRSAADNLAAWKREKGIATNVFEVGTSTSLNTAVKIDKFIENRYDKCVTRPSYVLLLGDAEFIPTFYPYSATDHDNAGSDFEYSNYVQVLFDAFFPDFGLGRIPVDTNDQAQTVVDKIIGYEKTPPFINLVGGAPFYTTVGLATDFQCCQMNQNGTPSGGTPGTDQRAFVETSELQRNSLVTEGYTVPRLYNTTVDGGGYCLINPGAGNPCPADKIQQAYTGDTTPRNYFNGTSLPTDINGTSGFAWTKTTSDIVSAWNQGRFLMIHRDHGWQNGWGTPSFSTADIPSIINGALLPVVLSINCASGLFDNETAGGIYGTTAGAVYFSEQLLRKADGGAIAIIGDTRNSPTWANNALARGYMDAMFPNTIPTFGTSGRHKRLGDVLNWGKIYLASQVGITQTAGDVSTDDMGYEYHIWHLIGDPTLEMWTHNPYRLKLSSLLNAVDTGGRLQVLYPQNGATITVLQTIGTTTVPIGRAVVTNGIANVPVINQVTPEYPLQYSASLTDAVSVALLPQRQF